MKAISNYEVNRSTRATFLIRLEPELKDKLEKIAVLERRSITSLILLLIDKKIAEVENARSKAN